MTRSRVAAAAIVAAGLATCAVPGAAPAAASKPAAVQLPVWALLDGDTPVRRGHVKVYAGRLPARGARRPLRIVGGARAARTNGAGVALLRVRRLPRSFTVVVSGGRVDRRAMRGALSTQVRGYRRASGDVVYVNPVTTLVDAWRRIDPGVGAARARRTIYRALGIPNWVDGADLRSNDRWVDARVLLRHVRVRGSIDALTNRLVIDVRRGRRHIVFTAPAARGRAAVAQTADAADWWQASGVSDMVSGGFEMLGGSLFSTVYNASFNWALGQFLHAVGLDSVLDFLVPGRRTAAQLRAIQGQLTDVRVLVESNIQATTQSDYAQKVARVAPIVATVKTLTDHFAFLASMDPREAGRRAYAADLVADIRQQLVTNGFADDVLDAELRSPAPLAYGILQSASAYMGSRRPFFTERSSAAVQSVFDFYQLVQLQLAILLTNYRMALPDASARAVDQDVVQKIRANIELQRTLLKPSVPAGSFVDLRTGVDKPDMLLWGPSRWVGGAALQPTCDSGNRYVGQTHLCDPLPAPSPSERFANERELQGLVDGWSGETPLSWLEEKTGLTISRAPRLVPSDERGFVWTGPLAVEIWCANKIACQTMIWPNWREQLHRIDFLDTTKPHPDGWVRSLRDLDGQSYAANAFDRPTPVAAGTFFWPVGG